MKLTKKTLISIASTSHAREVPILVDSVYFTTRNFTRRQLSGYDSPALFTHPTILEKLIAVNSHLQENDKLQIIIKDAYRPTEASRDMNEWAQEKGLYSEYVPKYIGLPGKSQHNNASAIDLTLADMQGRELWMGSFFDEFNSNAHYGPGRDIQPDDHQWSMNGDYRVLEESIQDIRNKLRSNMEQVGMLPYDEEWWHFYDPDLVNGEPI